MYIKKHSIGIAEIELVIDFDLIDNIIFDKDTLSESNLKKYLSMDEVNSLKGVPLKLSFNNLYIKQINFNYIPNLYIKTVSIKKGNIYDLSISSDSQVTYINIENCKISTLIFKRHMEIVALSSTQINYLISKHSMEYLLLEYDNEINTVTIPYIDDLFVSSETNINVLYGFIRYADADVKNLNIQHYSGNTGYVRIREYYQYIGNASSHIIGYILGILT